MIGNGLTPSYCHQAEFVRQHGRDLPRPPQEKLRLANGMELVRRAVEWVNRQQK
jgi:hypothetical protein